MSNMIMVSTVDLTGGLKKPRLLEKVFSFFRFLGFNVRRQDTKLWHRNSWRISQTC